MLKNIRTQTQLEFNLTAEHLQAVRVMSKDDIHSRLNELMAMADARRLSSDVWFLFGSRGGASFDFLTQEEKQERHELILMLPSYGEEATAAKLRIQERIRQRNLRKKTRCA